MTITKDSLVEMVHNEVGLNKREAKELIECFFEQIKKSLEEGNDIKLSGFGNFILRDKSPRPGRNPKTGEEVPITARSVVTFRASNVLKSKVNVKNKINILE